MVFVAGAAYAACVAFVVGTAGAAGEAYAACVVGAAGAADVKSMMRLTTVSGLLPVASAFGPCGLIGDMLSYHFSFCLYFVSIFPLRTCVFPWRTYVFPLHTCGSDGVRGTEVRGGQRGRYVFVP